MILCLDVWDLLNVNAFLMLPYGDMLAALDEMRLMYAWVVICYDR